MTMQRLQKRIAASGLCSRRKAEEYITLGHVKVNGRITKELGTKVSEKDKIEVKNHALPQKTAPITLALYKPRGVLVSKSDPFHKETVMDLLPIKYRHLNPIGRLDKDSEGLLLFTSDGDLQNRLTHAKYGHKKTYHVLVKGAVDNATLRAIRKGGQKLDDYALRPMEVEIISPHPTQHKLSGITRAAVNLTATVPTTWLEITLGEGRKRQIRRVMEMLGHPVLRLMRIKIGELTLEPLQEKQWRVLSLSDIEKL